MPAGWEITDSRATTTTPLDPTCDVISRIKRELPVTSIPSADKSFTWVHATEAKFSNPAVTRLMDLVEADPAPPPVKYAWAWGGTVTIVTTSGARFTSTVDAPRGSAPRGIAWSDVEAKYRALMPLSGLETRRADRVLQAIHDLEQLRDVSRLARMLA
jgi:2-methylcitrate dehydratase PrpD